MSEPNEYPSPSFRMIAVIALLVGVGAGVFAFFSFVLPSLTDNGQQVYIQADKSPTKTPPDQPGGMDIPHQDKMVFNSVASPNARQNPPERLAPPPEEPVFGGAAQAPAVQSGSGASGQENLVATQLPAGQTDTPGAKPTAPAANNMPSALGRAIQPVVADAPAPTAPEVKTTEITTSFDPAKPESAEKKKAKAAKEAKEAKDKAAAASAAAGERKSGPQAMEVEVAPAGQQPSAIEATAAPLSITPSIEGTEHITANPLMATEEIPAQEPGQQKMAAMAPGAKPVVEGSGGSARFQLASFTDRESAEAAVQNMRSKYSSALGGAPLQVTSATVKGKQVFRVQGSASSKDEVEGICSRVKASGGACVVAR